MSHGKNVQTENEKGDILVETVKQISVSKTPHATLTLTASHFNIVKCLQS